MNPKYTQKNSQHIVSALTIGQVQTEPQIDSEKYLTQSVCFNYWSITDCNQNLLSKIARTECLVQSLVNYLLNPKFTLKIANKECLFSTVQLLTEPKSDSYNTDFLI